MSAERRTKPPLQEEVALLKKKVQALRRQVKALETERDEYVHAANSLSTRLVTTDQIHEWERNWEADSKPGGSLSDLIKRWTKEVKSKKKR